ncbi:sensor histidine kinase, partial [Bacillus chungangensis]
MKSIKRKIALQFTMQFFIVSVFVFCLFLFLLFLLVHYLVIDEMKRNFPVGAIDLIVSETDVSNGVATVPSDLQKQIKENNMWLQIVDKEGNVIYSIAAPAELPNTYTAPELIKIEETNRFKTFHVQAQIDTMFNDTSLFLLGYEDHFAKKLEEWANEFGTNGVLTPEFTAEIEKKVSDIDGYLHIMDKNGNIIQAIGDQNNMDNFSPLDVLKSKVSPEKEDPSISIYHDPIHNQTWMLYRLKSEKQPIMQPIMIKKMILVLLVFCLIVLLMSIGFSAWNAFRYGQPLLLFIGWMERMEQGLYEEVLTKKERKKVFKKNGKIRMRYRLYEEVINTFYLMAEKLDRSDKERQLLEKTREEWMTGISHDLRTPLSTIQGYGHLLESGQYEWTKEELQEMGETIREKGTYMVQLATDFTLAFQLKNSTLPLSMKKLDLVKIVQEQVLKFANDVTMQHVSFTFMDKTEEITNIMADQKWFERMLDNFLYNAVKHNPAGTEVSAIVKQRNQQAILIITDNGIGIDEETKDHFFDRYYRGTNTDETTEGAGLGMSIAKAIVEAHQGEIQLESTVGKGTTITIS